MRKEKLLTNRFLKALYHQQVAVVPFLFLFSASKVITQSKPDREFAFTFVAVSVVFIVTLPDDHTQVHFGRIETVH